ncbi:unnamed protein product [Orchesella dallaii]|uniref:C2H2-type domain-containing protein n=1 Tax=Orchesella dallaii TaxID=48710 RepID=A0ABP1Q776_9HEXA
MDSSSEPTIDSNPDVEEEKVGEELEGEGTVKADESGNGEGETEQSTESSGPAEAGNNGAEEAEKVADDDASKKGSVEGDGRGEGNLTSSSSQNADSTPHYRCQLCNIFLGSVELMQLHMNETHPEIATKKMAFKCDKCGVLFPRLDLYHEHAKLHAEGKVVPVKEDSRPKLKVVEPKFGAIQGRQIRFVVGSSIKVVRPRSSTPNSVLMSSQGGTGTPITIQCPEHHFELNSNNISIVIGSAGQPQLEWVLDVPPL